MSYSADQPRDERGRWSAGSASGDHQAEARDPSDRRVVTAHAEPSVGTGPRLSAAARDAVIRGKMVDQSHFSNRGPDTLSKARDLGMREPPGKLDPSNNDHINAVLRGNANATPRIQPTAGQMVGAGLIKGS